MKSLSEAGGSARRRRRAASGPSRACRISRERAALDRDDLEALAAAGAFACSSGNRHLAFWEVAGTEKPAPLAPRSTQRDARRRPAAAAVRPPKGRTSSRITATGLTLGRHPTGAAARAPRAQAAHARGRAGSGCRTERWCARPASCCMRQRPGKRQRRHLRDDRGRDRAREHHRLGERGRAAAPRCVESRLLEVHGAAAARRASRTWSRARSSIDRAAWRAARAIAGTFTEQVSERWSRTLAGRSRSVGLVSLDVVVVEVADELGGALLLEQPLEAAPGRIAQLLAAALGNIQVLDDLRDRRRRPGLPARRLPRRRTLPIRVFRSCPP